MRIQPWSVVGFRSGHTPSTYSNLSSANLKIRLLHMDTISRKIVQELESAEKQSCLHVASDRQPSVRRVYWFSADQRSRFHFALTLQSFTVLTLFVFLTSPDNWQGECRSRLPPQSDRLWTECVWIPGALLSLRLSTCFLPCSCCVLWSRCR